MLSPAPISKPVLKQVVTTHIKKRSLFEHPRPIVFKSTHKFKNYSDLNNYSKAVRHLDRLRLELVEPQSDKFKVVVDFLAAHSIELSEDIITVGEKEDMISYFIFYVVNSLF